jgi:hypothetical protein
VTLQRRYRFDGILVNLPGRPPDLLATRLKRLEHTPETTTLLWDTGEVTRLPPDDNPLHYAAAGKEPERADFAVIDPARLERIHRHAGYTWNIYHAPWLEVGDDAGLLPQPPPCFTRTIDLVRAATGGTVSVHGEVFSPFTHFMELFGYEAALLALVSDPAKASALLEQLTAPAIAWGVAQARRGVDAVLVSSAFAGAGFISRAMYERFVLPHERRLHLALQTEGVPTYTHTCGRLGDRLDLLAATATNGVDTLDPPPLGDLELAKAKRRIGDRLFIKGNMNAVALLAAQTPAEVIAAASACLRDGQPGGGYILSTACSVAPRVEPWKLELLTPLAEELAGFRRASS